MITIIAGSREIVDYGVVKEAVMRAALYKGIAITEVISGGARGVDSLAISYAKEYNLPYRVMFADWDTYGRRAGYRRNEAMADVAEALVAVWDGTSSGTRHMINTALDRDLPTYVLNLQSERS